MLKLAAVKKNSFNGSVKAQAMISNRATESILHLATWNIGFGSKKQSINELSDRMRADQILAFISQLKKIEGLDLNVIALQETADRTYEDSARDFCFSAYLQQHDPQTTHLHIEPTLALGDRNSYPFGTYQEFKDSLGIRKQTQGNGIWIRNLWQLHNLYTPDDDMPARVEVQRPIPTPLYMADQPLSAAGRDEEDRPILWSRVDLKSSPINRPIFFVSLHFPTLKNEEKEGVVSGLNAFQQDLAHNTLGIEDATRYTVDELAYLLRIFVLRQLIAQANRLEKYWDILTVHPQRCIFILAGDLNFRHTNSVYHVPTAEEQFLLKAGFHPSKKTGFTREGRQRLVDNIWIRGNNAVWEELRINGLQIESSSYADSLKIISDHYPVLAALKIRMD